ncbi:hypothetical protein Tco_0560565, partial [Tanacetum coccineum]
VRSRGSDFDIPVVFSLVIALLRNKLGIKLCLKFRLGKGSRFGKRGKLNARYVGPFKVLKKVGSVAYKLELPEELSRVHNTFHVSNLKKCYANEPLAVPLDALYFDDKLQFVEEPVEIMDRKVKRLKQSRIPIIKRLTVSKAIRFNVPRHALSCSTALTTTIGKTHSLRLNGGLPISESDVLSERTVSTRTSPRKWPCDYKDSPVPHLGASCCRESVISQKEEGSGDVGRERGYMDGRCVFYAVGSVGLREGGVGEVRILSFH